MPFSRPSLSALISRAKSDLKSRLLGDPFLRRAVEGAFATMSAGLTHGLYGFIDWVSKQAVPGVDTDAENILRWAALFLSPPRVQATKASGPATFTGTPGTDIPAGTEVQLGDGTTYTTDALATIGSSPDEVTVNVTASEAGKAGEASAGATISLTSPIAGIDTDGTVDAGGLTGGTDIETIEDVFERLQERLATPPRGGGKGDFVEWALETPTVDVDKAWEYPKRNGPGTVGLAFTVDGGPISTSGDMDAVQAYVESKDPTFMRSLDMITLTPVALTLTINVEPNTAAVQAAIRAELQDLLDREAEPEKVLPLSHISEAISVADGEEDHAITFPTGDIDPGPGGLFVYDAPSITFASL